MNGIELRHLRALVAVAEEGTFTDAAIRLGLTQSAVSRTVSSMEQLMGTRLLRRTTRSVALTAAGEQAYRAAVIALAAVQDVLDAATGRTRPLRLGYAWSALGRHTSPVLQRWRTEYPQTPLEVHRVDERTAGLSTGRADVAVIRGRFEDPALIVRWIADEPRYAAFGRAHRLAGREIVAMAELVADTVLSTPYGTTTPELWPAGSRPTSTLYVDNVDEWLTEIAGGMAIGLTPESTLTQHAHPGVTFVPIADVKPVAMHLAWPRAAQHPAIESFVDLVERTVRSAAQ